MSASAVVKEAHFGVLVSPVVTEKSQAALEKNKVVFKVASSADKPAVRAAVEALFGVKVLAVNILNREGKNKIFRGHRGRRPDSKMAIVTLAPGQQIDLAAGI